MDCGVIADGDARAGEPSIVSTPESRQTCQARLRLHCRRLPCALALNSPDESCVAPLSFAKLLIYAISCLLHGAQPLFPGGQAARRDLRPAQRRSTHRWSQRTTTARAVKATVKAKNGSRIDPLKLGRAIEIQGSLAQTAALSPRRLLTDIRSQAHGSHEAHLALWSSIPEPTSTLT